MYSVWNPAARAFDYYETKAVQPTHTPAARHVPASGLGATPEETAWPLPAAARKVGSGAEARGRIAVRGGGSVLAGLESSPGVLLAGALAAAYLIHKKVR